MEMRLGGKGWVTHGRQVSHPGGSKYSWSLDAGYPVVSCEGLASHPGGVTIFL